MQAYCVGRNDNSIQYCTLEDEIRANQWDEKGMEETNIPNGAKLYSEEIDKKDKGEDGAIKYY